MKRIWNHILTFLREPAVRTILAIISFLFTVGGTITSWFTYINNWVIAAGLYRTSVIQNRILLVLILVIMALTTLLLILFRRFRNERKINRNGARYEKVWGVLWGWPPTMGSFIGEGPICPIHKLKMDVVSLDPYRGENSYSFYCPGQEGGSSHKIPGPRYSQLVGSGNRSGRDINLYEDVNSRIRAKYL